MIEAAAVVVDAHADTLEVEVRRASACGACSANAACGVSVLDRLLGRRRQRILVTNNLGAAVGEMVLIGIPEGVLLKAAAAAYLGPLAGLIGGGLVGEALARAALLPPVATPAGGGAPAAGDAATAAQPILANAQLAQVLSPSSVLVLLGALAGFGAALLLLRRYSRRLTTDPRYRAVLLRRQGVSMPGRTAR